MIEWQHMDSHHKIDCSQHCLALSLPSFVQLACNQLFHHIYRLGCIRPFFQAEEQEHNLSHVWLIIKRFPPPFLKTFNKICIRLFNRAVFNFSFRNVFRITLFNWNLFYPRFPFKLNNKYHFLTSSLWIIIISVICLSVSITISSSLGCISLIWITLSLSITLIRVALGSRILWIRVIVLHF